MPEKEKRNKEFIKAWKEEGLTDKELMKRFNLSKGGVKGLKARLRKKNSSLYVNKSLSQQVDKSTSQQITKSTNQQVYKRATYYLTPEIVKKIKLLAVKRDVDTSNLMREILTEYLSQQGDL
jgi:transposase